MRIKSFKVTLSELLLFATIFVSVVNQAKCATTIPPGCTYEGVHYAIGQQFQPSACKDCHCTTSGQAICAIGDCFYIPCVDYVRVPTKCCPVCPNGENCKAADGTVIKKGDTYRPDSLTECRCPENNNFFFTGNRAICAHKQPTTTTPIPTFAPTLG